MLLIADGLVLPLGPGGCWLLDHVGEPEAAWKWSGTHAWSYTSDSVPGSLSGAPGGVEKLCFSGESDGNTVSGGDRKVVCWRTSDFFLNCICTFCTSCVFVCGPAMREDLENKKCQPSRISKSN